MTLYSRIESFGYSFPEDYCTTCDEWKAFCPECISAVCVFCEDECPGCDEPLW